MIETENPRIRPVGDILNENFFVPRYQRGYRWGEQEITELLDDVLQYYKLTQNRENKVSKFYCLQPIVIKRREWKNNENETVKGWELIDGQQRLTTILIILCYLEDVRKIVRPDTNIYSIDFETREDCNAFFTNKVFTIKIDDSNVDFYHISKAYEYVSQWFERQLHKLEVLNTFLKTEYNVSLIWYEAREALQNGKDDNSIDLFTRLNEGKIPLTDAELIKALLLQADLYPAADERYFKQRLFEIASEWDEIEAELQDEKMWLFINDTSYQPSSKIELIFKLLAERWNGGNEQKLVQYIVKEGKPRHFEYLVFDRYLNNKRKELENNRNPNKDILDPVNDIWKEVKDIYSIFSEWYEDHTLFHYIGYLLAIDSKNNELLIKELISIKNTKKKFIEYLKKKIAIVIKIKKKRENLNDLKQLSELSYGDDDAEIRKILLLFNIETLVWHKKENARFPFHLYKKENITSIEHIHPQNPESIDTDEERSKTWLRSHAVTLALLNPVNDIQKDKIRVLLLGIEALLITYDKEKFKIIFSDTIELYSEIAGFKENETHTLYNLALVDKDTNSVLNNSFFDIKREILKENKSGKYIPICTQRVFSKYYSASPQEMIFWANKDRKSYFNAIEETYITFVKLLGEKDGNK